MVQKIYVGNLPFDATERDLSAAFAAFGTVVSIALPTDRETGRPRGFGFIEMSSEDAAKAIAGLNGKDFGGRALNVNEAKPREAMGDRNYGGGGSYGNRR
jgi:RNA recognition motif-containing protein